MLPLKTIANILLVNINRPAINGQLVEHGYKPVHVSDLTSIEAIESPYALMLIHDYIVVNNLIVTPERLQLLNNSVPTAVLIDDPAHIDKRLLSFFNAGTLDWIFSTEVEAGLLGSRIDKLFIASMLDGRLKAQQRELREKERLKKEITLRDNILDHERELNANIAQSITSGLVIIDLAGTVIMLNENARTLLNLNGTDYLGSPYSKVLRGKIRTAVDDFMKRVHLETLNHEIKRITISATVNEIAFYKMRDYRHAVSGVLLLINDITDHENITQQLYRAEKLATMGTMLSGIAHELRNPLSIISARAQMALSKNSWEKEWLIKNFESIQSQTARCAMIINNLLDFSRYRATQMSLHAVDGILDEALTYVEYQKSFESIIVKKNYQTGLKIYGDRSRYLQAFLNIITNAADAMNGTGALTLTIGQENREWVIVEIGDSGSGIDGKVKNKVFDPFFTTKEPGKGTGLGLAVVQKIIHESGGEVWFTSQPGATTFFVKLPTGKKLYE